MSLRDIETFINSQLTVMLEIPLKELFKILRFGTDITVNLMQANKTLSVCLLVISFSLLIISFVYFNQNLAISQARANNNSSIQQQRVNFNNNSSIQQQQCVLYNNNQNLLIKYCDFDFIEDSYLNYFPDVHDSETVNVREALKAVKKALQFKQRNNMDKAQKLFQVALVQSRNHPDVLLHYGEFLESGIIYADHFYYHPDVLLHYGEFFKSRIIYADHFYLKAILLGQNSSRAQANFKRTFPVVYQFDHEELTRIGSKKADLIRLNIKDPKLKRLQKVICRQHIHHTVAIKGNTKSSAEICGLDAALDYVNQTLVSDSRDICVSDILEIHKRVMEHIDPKTAGKFRKDQCCVGDHTPPSASDVKLLIDKFINKLSSPAIKNMHPVLIAAFVHHKLVFIHPFVDGNGRTARLLMNLIFLRYGYPPIIIRKEDRSQYYKLLQIANEGDRRPFYRFIARTADYTIDAFLRAHECKQSELKVLESTHDIKDIIPLQG